MLMCKWEELPQKMQNDEVRLYWELLNKKKINLIAKRVFDIGLSVFLLLLSFWVFIILAIVIKFDSKGPIYYRQVRITQFGKEFRIHKFRSMTIDADKGNLVTSKGDNRVTKVGKFIRKYRLDEIPQLIDILQGNMSFVGTRPEVPKYVENYSNKMLATLLLPAGVTSEASILYKNENELLNSTKNAENIYIKKILPIKMYYNLKELPKEGILHDIKIILMTIFAIFGKDYKGDYKEEEYLNE